MATKRPVRRVANTSPKASTTLMGNQDVRHKGDSTSRKKDKLMTFWVTEDQKQAITTYASDHNMTVSRLIVEGLEMRMGTDSI